VSEFGNTNSGHSMIRIASVCPGSSWPRLDITESSWRLIGLVLEGEPEMRRLSRSNCTRYATSNRCPNRCPSRLLSTTAP